MQGKRGPVSADGRFVTMVIDRHLLAITLSFYYELYSILLSVVLLSVLLVVLSPNHYLYFTGQHTKTDRQIDR